MKQTTKRCLIPLLFGLYSAIPAWAADGVVSHNENDCAYFIIQTASGYAVSEWNGESKPQKGDRLQGEFNAGGMRILNNLTAGTKTRVWIEDYPIAQDQALRQLKGECG